MNDLSQDLKTDANEQAILNTLMYLDYGNPNDNDTLEQIVANIKVTGEDEKRQLEVVQNAIKDNPHLASLTIGNQSKNMPGFDDGKGLNACTFTDPATGSVSVVFRGTGSGEWLDNGYGVSGIITDTQQQKQALAYFNEIVSKNGYAEKGIDITISGHSKGGNKAQYITVNSEYNYLIDSCYNFDGQGMSPEAIEAFKERYGEQAYQDAVNKMYGFYSENDFVNPLGITIVPKDNRYYFDNAIVEGIDDFAKNHYADGYLNLDGTFTKQVERGAVSKLIGNFSEEISSLPPGVRSVIADSIMALMQGDNETVDGSSISTMRVIEGMVLAAPVLIVDLLGTPNGWNAILELAGEGLVTIREKYGPLAEWGVAAAAVIIVVCFAPIILKTVALAVIINVCEVLVSKLIEFGKSVWDATTKIIEGVQNWMEGVQDWWNKNFNAGYKYANANPFIKIDTSKLRTYAQRLESVNNRLESLDYRLDSLYWRVGLLDLWDIMHADFKIGRSSQISGSASYLYDTADEFENVESSIIAQLG